MPWFVLGVTYAALFFLLKETKGTAKDQTKPTVQGDGVHSNSWSKHSRGGE
jgi:hypothetical protein